MFFAERLKLGQLALAQGALASYISAVKCEQNLKWLLPITVSGSYQALPIKLTVSAVTHAILCIFSKDFTVQYFWTVIHGNVFDVVFCKIVCLKI